MLNNDYKDILSGLLAQKAEFILVGAYALAAHGFPRASMGIDLWFKPKLDIEDLITNKKATGRSKDIADVEVLTHPLR